MSGIYIPGMEMPTNCYECRFGYWPSDGSRPYCIVTDEDADEPDYCSKRMAHCPLTPIPPHGRLIDADAFAKANAYFWGMDFINAKYEDCLCDLVNAAPTIIPASEEVYDRYTDTAGNLHWTGTHSGKHIVKAEENE